MMIAQSATTRTYFQWMRLQALDQWWHWMVLVAICMGLFSFVWFWYRRDTRELPRGTRWTLILLRVLAFAGVLLFFLDLQKRSERQVTKNSRVAVLVDTSQSMALPAGDPEDQPSETRIERVTNELEQGTLCPRCARNMT